MSALPGFASRLFVNGTLAFILIGVLGAAYGVALPTFTRMYDLGPGAAGLILTVSASGGMFAVIALTAGLPYLGSRTAMVLLGSGSGLVALGLSWPLTVLGGLCAGAGFGLIATHVNRSFLTGFGPRGPGMVGLINAISGIGLVIAPLLFILSGNRPAVIFGGIAIAALALVMPFPAAAAHDVGPRGFPPLFKPRMGILLVNVASGVIEMAVVGLGVTALIATGWSQDAAAALASVFFAAFLVARLALYWLSLLLAPEYLLLTGIFGTAASMAVAAFGLEAVGYVVSGFFIGLVFPSFYVWGSRVLGPDPRMGAAMMVSGLSGGALGPLVFGALLAQIGFPYLWASVAITGTVLTIIVALVLRPIRMMLARDGAQG